MQLKELQQLIITALEDLKAIDIQVIKNDSIASFTDVMLIASGSSTRQVKALADKVVEQAKVHGVRPLGMEGARDAEWVLIDFGDAVVHIMLPQTREFYALEKLWNVSGTPSGSSVVNE